MAHEASPAGRTRQWYRPMRPRDRQEEHRASTPLELLFDLCFVVAVGQAAAQLHHALGEGHVGHGVLSFAMVFFAVWWGWLNFSWFASAFDTDDVPYRLATLVQIAGGLTVAAGVDRAFDGNYDVVVAGYVLLRLAAVVQWLRAARQSPETAKTAYAYAVGITVVQVLWIARLALPESLALASFLVLVLLEFAVPLLAESRAGTTWHPHHIAERYGLFTLIVLGETVLSATNAVKEGLAAGAHTGDLVSLAVAGLVLVFSMWWLYFDRPGHARLTRGDSLRTALSWGYGHYLIFGSAAAVGTGLELAVDFDSHHTALGGTATALAVTVPVAVFLLSVWLLHIGPTNECRPIAVGFPVAALLILGASFGPAPIHLTAVLAAGLVAVTVVATHGQRWAG
ncbi:low temperature requirement protein A [Amycolatopsis sulphurea]|nr:low temperature requirement protein A [Amycolatopsis sulphurea]